MDDLNLELRTMDVAWCGVSPQALAEEILNQTLASWERGADLVVYPEFAWMVLERFAGKNHPLEDISRLFWHDLWPGLQSGLSRAGKAVVLGSVPFREENGTFRNRVPILSAGEALIQDKIHLTPWESAFAGGGPLRIWEFMGWRVAVVVCLDIEIPEIAAALRGRQVDLILVPSATDGEIGAARILRCASARAVELGAYVGVCPLVGRMESAWVDENLGSLACYAPSQAAFSGMLRENRGDLLSFGMQGRCFRLSKRGLHDARQRVGETNPSLLRVSPIVIED